MILLAEEFLVLLLLGLKLQQKLLDIRSHRKRSAAGIVLCLVFGDHGGDLGNSAADCDGLGLKVDAVPTQTQRLAPPQSVKGGQPDERIEGFAFDLFQKLIDLRFGVEFRLITLASRKLHELTGITGNHSLRNTELKRLIHDVLDQLQTPRCKAALAVQLSVFGFFADVFLQIVLCDFAETKSFFSEIRIHMVFHQRVIALLRDLINGMLKV